MDTLEITSPPPRRVGALALCLITAAWLLMRMQHNAGKASATPLIGWIVACAMLVACLCIIARNLFFSESLSLGRGTVVSVAEADRPTYGTMAWSMSWWGFGGERLAIDASAGCILFGIGLRERQAADLLARINVYRRC